MELGAAANGGRREPGVCGGGGSGHVCMAPQPPSARAARTRRSVAQRGGDTAASGEGAACTRRPAPSPVERRCSRESGSPSLCGGSGVACSSMLLAGALPPLAGALPPLAGALPPLAGALPPLGFSTGAPPSRACSAADLPTRERFAGGLPGERWVGGPITSGTPAGASTAGTRPDTTPPGLFGSPPLLASNSCGAESARRGEPSRAAASPLRRKHAHTPRAPNVT